MKIEENIDSKDNVMQEVKDFLVLNRDNRYLEFSSSIGINSNKKRLGVRIPVLRQYAKSLSKKYSLDYLLENIGEYYYEEVMLKGFIIGNYNLTYQELIKYIDYYLPKITDWSLCDTFVASLKITKKYSFELWNYLIKKTECKKEFFVRFSLVMILNYYINDEYKERIYQVINSIKLDKYYVKMANAWLISYMIINYYNDTIKFISTNKFDLWTLNKGITKAIESYRLTSIQKEYLKEIRKKVK